MEPGGLSFYTVPVYFDTLTRLFGRLGSEGYPLYGVVAELVLIGLLVNWCAGVLHGTRGTRLLRGLLIVLVAATLIVNVLADQLGWVRLDLLYRYFIFGMAFIALVAFQPELRRALIRAGEMRFMQRAEPHGKLISSLVESAGYLSRNRYGALIAIQRDVGLANWAEHGTQLYAEVSAN
jgi:diadenylate cyclase